MGKTYHKSPKRYDEEDSSGRSGKHHKHSNNRKTGGLKTLNSYVDEDYDDPFVDKIDGITDEIFIQHIQNDTK